MSDKRNIEEIRWMIDSLLLQLQSMSESVRTEKEEFNRFSQTILKTASQVRSGVIGGVVFVATLAVGIAPIEPSIPLITILVADFLIGLIFYVYWSIGQIQNQKRFNKISSSLNIPEVSLSSLKEQTSRMPSELIRSSNMDRNTRLSIEDLFALQEYIVLLFAASHFRYFKLLEDAQGAYPFSKNPFKSICDSSRLLILGGLLHYMKKKEQMSMSNYVKGLDKTVNNGLKAIYAGVMDFKPFLEFYEQLKDDPPWNTIIAQISKEVQNP